MAWSSLLRLDSQAKLSANELPDDYRNSYAEIDFDYEHPTITTMDHPGPAQVTLIHGDADDA